VFLEKYAVMRRAAKKTTIVPVNVIRLF